MRTAFHHDGKYGFVDYDEDNKEVLVSHPNNDVRLAVKDYLTSPHRFIMSDYKEGIVGNRRIETKKPTESSHHLNMALCEMFFNTGVHVDWAHKNNILSRAEKNLANGGHESIVASNNKKILKSIDGDEQYELI